MSVDDAAALPPFASPARVVDRGANLRPAWRPLAVWGATVAVLLIPALWNGVAFVFADTGGYLLRPLEGTLELGRSALYGAFIAFGVTLDFWPAVLAQAALTAWVIMLTLRTHGHGAGFALAIVPMLALVTSLPWFVGQLMPDIFVPLAVLGLYLLAFRRAQVRTFEIIALTALVAFAIASHMAILATALVLLFALVGLRTMMPRLLPARPNIAAPAGAVASGIALALISNLAIAGVLGFTPGGSSFLFGRLIKDGIVARYLEEKCPDSRLRLCPYRHELPETGDDWLWQDRSPLHQLGGWEEFEPEAKRVILDTLRLYPAAHVSTALLGTIEQLVTLDTGEGLHPYDNWHVEWVLTQHAPNALARYHASAQYRDRFDFIAINRVQVPIALTAMASLPVLFIVLRRRGHAAAALVLTVLIALLANAAICGIFSSPSFRYQSRLVPLAVLAVILAALDLRRSGPAAMTAAAPSRHCATPDGARSR
jgi:hypothetical protein